MKKNSETCWAPYFVHDKWWTMALGRKCTVYGMLMKISTTEGGERKGYSGVYLRLQYEESK